MIGAPATIVGCILTKDEERNVERVVSSLAAVTDEVVVVDSESQDATGELASAAGAHVLVHPFAGYAAQRNWAFEQISEIFGKPWVLTLDADEWLSPELTDELRALRPRLGDGTDVYLLRRRTRFAGRILRHGGLGTTWLARLARSDYARYEERGVNEHLAVPPNARVTRLQGWLEHADVDDWARYIDKHNRYSTLEAEARVRAAREGSTVRLTEALRDVTMRRRFVRQRIYDHLPVRPAVRFVVTYVFLRGFLDGRAGFDRALFNAWQELCIDLKAREITE